MAFIHPINIDSAYFTCSCKIKRHFQLVKHSMDDYAPLWNLYKAVGICYWYFDFYLSTSNIYLFFVAAFWFWFLVVG